MFRDTLTNRGLLAGTIFFLLIVIGGSLYLQHLKRATEEKVAQMIHIPPQVEPISPVQSAQKPKHPGLNGVEKTDVPTTEEPASDAIVSAETGVIPIDDADLTVATDVLDILLEANIPEPVNFKTTPAGFPLAPYWDYPEDEQRDWSYEHKLIDHVLVKLWEQGARDFVGGSIDQDTRRVYPHYLSTLYVEWQEVEHPEGGMVKRITRALGAGDVKWDQRDPFALPPSGVRLIDMNSREGQGIDPFTFLTREELP